VKQTQERAPLRYLFLSPSLPPSLLTLLPFLAAAVLGLGRVGRRDSWTEGREGERGGGREGGREGGEGGREGRENPMNEITNVTN